jgi:hypothetical protein
VWPGLTLANPVLFSVHMRAYPLYAKTAVPNGDQAFAAVRQSGGRWVEDPPLLHGVRIERLAVVRRSTVDWVYLAAPTEKKLYLHRLALTSTDRYITGTGAALRFLAQFWLPRSHFGARNGWGQRVAPWSASSRPRLTSWRLAPPRVSSSCLASRK